jgi:cytochrome b561/polyisoprenoid-binding protein YceI
MSLAETAPPARRAAATNTETTYGWVERAFHWSLALLIPTAIALGVVAYDWSYDTDAALATKATLFSLHKTVGLAILFIALARIAWALSQPRPKPLHGGAERFAASVVHWLLYGSLVLVPLLGWAHHATSQGFAPIWWPFGQSLPFLPKDPKLSATLGMLHFTFQWVLTGALLLHIAGTVKHVVLDRDGTFARMWRGAEPRAVAPRGGLAAPLAVAGLVWAGALGAGLILTPEDAPAAPVQLASTEGASNWTVQDGTVALTVTQMGTPVTGRFADWQAAIDFDEMPRADGTLGTVEVSVATGSVTLGSVSNEARSGDFLASETFPTATYDAVIRPDGEDYVAEGTFALRGVEVPLALPFTLRIEDDVAVMQGQAVLDRRTFGMGETYPDESSVGFAVTIDVDLTASRDE